MSEPDPRAVAAIRAWYRLDRAFAAANGWLRREYGITGEQVGIARIVGERESWALAELRYRLSMHPATLGQVLARLEERGLVRLGPDDRDGRRRTVALTRDGRELLAAIPLVGPVRLRTTPADPADLATVAEGFGLAVDLFGLDPFIDDELEER